MGKEEMESFYNMQDGNLKGTSYHSLIGKTDVSLGRNSHPSYIFFSLSDQILLITVNRHVTQANRFHRSCQEDNFTIRNRFPALLSPGIRQ